VSVAVPIPVIQLLQVLTVALAAPGVTGAIAKLETRLQGRSRPRIRQPYYDVAKLARKEALAPEGASWFFLAAPIIAVACYLTIPLLIPVLTSYPLPLGYMGDILGGGFLLALASFVIAIAALETGSPHAQLGSSRAKTFFRPRMQYSAMTFSAPTRVTFDAVYRPAVSVRRASDDDPGGRSGPVHDEAQVTPVFERYLYRPVIRAVEWRADAIRPMQSGDVNLYLLYVFAVILTAYLLGAV